MAKKIEFDIVINDADQLNILAKEFPEKLGAELTKRIDQALKALKDTKEGSPERLTAQQNIDNLFKEATDKLLDSIQGAGKEFVETLRNSIEQLAQLEKERAAQARKVGGLKQSFQLNEEGTEFVDLRSREKEKEILQKQLDLYKQQAIAAGKLTEEQAKLIPTSHTLLKDQDKMVEALHKTNLQNKQEIEDKIRLGQFSELTVDQQSKIVENMETTLTVAQHRKRQEHAMNAQLGQQEVKTNAINAANSELVKLNNQNLDIDKKRKEIADSLADTEVTTMTQETDPKLQEDVLKITNALNKA